MRISDWSSDVFSSDLDAILALGRSLDDLDRLARDAKSGVDNLTTNTRPISGAVDALSEAVAAATQGIDQGRSQTGDLDRSEEHTSELQSLMRISYAVFCLKKKKRSTSTTTHHTYIYNSKVTLTQHTRPTVI